MVMCACVDIAPGMYQCSLYVLMVSSLYYTSHAQFQELEARPFSEHRRSQVEPVLRTG